LLKAEKCGKDVLPNILQAHGQTQKVLSKEVREFNLILIWAGFI